VIHSEDWDVLLRWPRTTTILEVLLFVAVASLIVLAIYGYIRLASRAPLRLRGMMLAGSWSAGVFAVLAAGIGMSGRLQQAQCWRLGPEGMPPSDRRWCEAMPPEGNEGMYYNTIFGPSKR
jgi:hypothetical protein